MMEEYGEIEEVFIMRERREQGGASKCKFGRRGWSFGLGYRV